ncbi:MAG: cyclic dehypoxanthinyl futalosine synthase [Nitrospinota bacterium]|nr:cyclic dehypoxanthinyl futalosine synthase [Nitrospinota bacterium]
MTRAEEILKKSLDGGRIEKAEAVELFSVKDILILGNTASRLAKRKKPNKIVTYIVDRNVNYTNICVTDCTFCAFYRKKTDPDSYVLSFEEICTKIDETLELGGGQILLQGGHNIELSIDYFEDLFRRIKERYNIKLHALSPPEIIHTSKISKIPVAETLKRLQAAGLDSIPGGGAEILVDRVREKISISKCTTDEWLDVMDQAHRMRIPTTATMMFGHIETLEERVEHLIRLRQQQDKTGGFTAFITWPFQPGNNPLGAEQDGQHVSGLEYLKTLAISRIVLDNFDNLQSSWVTQGPKIGQMALFYGANDMGSTMIEENVVREAGTSFRMSEPEICRLITDGGFIPKKRNMRYEYI